MWHMSSLFLNNMIFIEVIFFQYQSCGNNTNVNKQGEMI